MKKERMEILVIEDDPLEAELIREILSKAGMQSYGVRQARNLGEGLGLLDSRSFDAILVDLGLPDSQGLDTALAVRKRVKTTPIIILTGLDDEETAFKALHMDIQDYLVKGEINSAMLKRSIRYAVQRKLDSEALQLSEQRFDSFMHNLPAAAWMKDVEGKYVYANPEAERVFSKSLPELLGRSDDELFPPVTARMFRKNDLRVLDEGGSLQTTETLRQADGIEHQSFVSKFSVPGPDGQPAFVGGIAFDVTEHRRAEESLRESEFRYRTLFDSIDEGFCIVEVLFGDNDKPIDYRFLETNPSFVKQTGLIAAEGKSMLELAPEHEEHWFEIYGKIALTGEPARFQEQAKQLNRWYDVFAFRFGQPEKRQVAILFNDITVRKHTEEEIERLNASLASRVSELEEINQELEAFNRTVSHDLRLPLNTIGVSSQAINMFCSDDLSEQCREYVRAAYDGVLRMNRLIDGLLGFSRSTHAELHRETIDVGEMAKDVAERLRLAEPGRRASFRIAEGLIADGDPNLLRSVLENLIGNAWKYSGTQEETLIEVGALEIGAKPAYFVRDNGNGFSMADADKLFTPFKRLPGAEGFNGFGIGLATAERIVRRHGGKVWAESEPGKGATFFFTLPRNQEIR